MTKTLPPLTHVATTKGASKDRSERLSLAVGDCSKSDSPWPRPHSVDLLPQNRIQSVPERVASATSSLVRPPVMSRPQCAYRRQPKPGKISVSDAIRKQVPHAMVVDIRFSEDSLNNFEMVFEEGAPSFLVVDCRAECATLAARVLRSQEAIMASAVILVFLQDENPASKPSIEKVRGFIASGADDVLSLPACDDQWLDAISLSLAKAEAIRQRTLNFSEERRDCSKQCYGLFWRRAHDIVPTFPQVKAKLKEIKDESVGDVSLLKKLGQGGFGAVHIWQREEQTGAVKITSKKTLNSVEQVVDIANEYTVLRKFDHPNVVKVYNLVHGMQNMYLFMAMAGTRNLFRVIETDGARWPWGHAACILLQISHGLAHCHEMRVAHCDLKPENIVISGDAGEECATIVDFGLAVDLDTEVPQLTRPRGTMPFMAPEVMRLSESWNPAALDVWSLGVMFMEMLCGNNAFPKLMGWREQESMDRSELSHRAEDLQSFFARNQTEAQKNALLSISGLCRDQPPPNVIDFLGQMLDTSPEQRIAAADAVKRLEEFDASL